MIFMPLLYQWAYFQRPVIVVCNFYTWMRLRLYSHLVACISVCSYNTFASCSKGIQASFMSALQRLKLLWKREPQLRISVPNRLVCGQVCSKFPGLWQMWVVLQHKGWDYPLVCGPGLCKKTDWLTNEKIESKQHSSVVSDPRLTYRFLLSVLACPTFLDDRVQYPLCLLSWFISQQ